jgi:hypothetical protein
MGVHLAESIIHGMATLWFPSYVKENSHKEGIALLERSMYFLGWITNPPHFMQHKQPNTDP